MNSEHPHLAEVHTLYDANARDIPAMLRDAADALENDDECSATAMIAVQLDGEGRVQVYGWGDTNAVHAASLLALGLHEIGSMILDTGDDFE